MPWSVAFTSAFFNAFPTAVGPSLSPRGPGNAKPLHLVVTGKGSKIRYVPYIHMPVD